MKLGTVLAAHARRRPDQVAVVCGPRRLTYRELDESSERIAAALVRRGFVPGDRIVLNLPNGIELVELFYGAMKAGAVVVPVSTRLAPAEVAFLFEDAQPKAVAYAAAHRAVVAAESRVARIAVGAPADGEIPFAELTAAPGERLPLLPGDFDDCMICYTSGTTGTPKGAIATHANILIMHGYINAVEWGIGADDRFLVTTPLAHRTAIGRLGNALCLGGTLVVMEKFDAAETVEVIARERITVAGMVPTVARLLLPEIERDPGRCASLRTIVVTGEAFPVEIKRRLIAALPQARLYSFFAMTEVGGVTSLGHEEQFTHPLSVGRPTPGVEVRLLTDAGTDAAAGEVGEILVRTGAPGRYTTMRGYFNRPKETAETIRDGWIHTGDLGRFDADGYLYIVDRKKDMILSGGYNIYSKEVERALLAHPGVQDVAVIGVPDETYGEAVAAYIERKPRSDAGAAELIEHCRQHIASYKKPKHVFFVEALPRNSVGKVLKQELRQRYLEGHAAR